MKTKISKDNPFIIGRLEHAYAWEMVKKSPKTTSFKVLDYGGYDGQLLEKFIKSKVVESCTTIDMNADIVNLNSNNISNGHELLVIKKGDPLPFTNECFDIVTIMGVIEHVYNQNKLLSEVYRVLKPGGILIVAVPGKHIFSFLDFGNWKFMLPRFHRFYIESKFGKQYYNRHFVECANGLIGDVELEKSWHEHFTHYELENLLNKSGFTVYDQDGFGFFYRIFHNIKWIFPVTSYFMNSLIKIDSRYFSKAELFCSARKK